MIRLKVKEILYKQGDNEQKAFDEENEHLIASVNLEGAEVPVKLDGTCWVFTKDCLVRFYSVESTDSNSEYDFQILEGLENFKENDPTELRYWFQDVPVGTHILKTCWSEEDSDGETDLQFESVEEEK